jgi:hypothetical protein
MEITKYPPRGDNDSEVLRETNEEMKYKIQPVKLIQHCPKNFMLLPFSSEFIQTMGGWKMMASAVLFGTINSSLSLFKNKGSSFLFKKHFFFTNFFLGAGIGLAGGLLRFADWQRIWNFHTAWVLTDRFKHCEKLKCEELWRYKGVPPQYMCYLE